MVHGISSFKSNPSSSIKIKLTNHAPVPCLPQNHPLFDAENSRELEHYHSLLEGNRANQKCGDVERAARSRIYERSWGRNLSTHIAGSVTFTKHGIYFHLGVACYQIHVDSPP